MNESCRARVPTQVYRVLAQTSCEPCSKGGIKFFMEGL